MENIGAYLRKEREERGISLEKLSGLTRINPGVLRKIEENDFRSVPQPVYLKSFLKSYASQLGLDHREILMWYEGQAPAPKPPAAVPVEMDRPGPRLRTVWGVIAVAAAVVVALSVFLMRR